MKSFANFFKTKKTLINVIFAVLLYVLLFLSFNKSLPLEFLNLSRTNQSLAIKMSYYIILAVSLNMVVGFLGELSLGHAGFFAIGAYSGCLIAKLLVSMGIPSVPAFFISCIIGGLAAALGGFLISSSILRLSGDYLAIVTLAFGEVIRSFSKIIPGLGGTIGLMDIPGFSSRTVEFTCSFILVVITLAVFKNITNSTHGRAVTAIRDNTIAAQSIGINVKAYKIKIFAISAFFAGVAGVLFGYYNNNIAPSYFTYNLSIEVLIMVVLGGIGSIKGSVIAAIVLTGIPDWLRNMGSNKFFNFIADQRMLVYSLVLIIMMLFTSAPAFINFRKKLFGNISNKFNFKNKNKKTAEEVA